MDRCRATARSRRRSARSSSARRARGTSRRGTSSIAVVEVDPRDQHRRGSRATSRSASSTRARGAASARSGPACADDSARIDRGARRLVERREERDAEQVGDHADRDEREPDRAVDVRRRELRRERDRHEQRRGEQPEQDRPRSAARARASARERQHAPRAIRAPPWSASTKIAGRITIEIHTFTPSANATTSANVRQRLSVVGSATASNVQRGRAPCTVTSRMKPPMKQVVVTIDGPAGPARSTVAKLLARRLGYRLLDTGAIYRAVALTAQRARRRVDRRAPACAELARELDIRFDFVGDKNHVYLAGEDVERRDPHPRGLAGRVAGVGAPRGARRAARAPAPARRGRRRRGRGPRHRHGRVPRRPGEVLPDRDRGGAGAAPGRRARRRRPTSQHTLREIQERDQRDASRDVAPMVPAEDAVLVDSSTQTLEQVVESLARTGRAPAPTA